MSGRSARASIDPSQEKVADAFTFTKLNSIASVGRPTNAMFAIMNTKVDTMLKKVDIFNTPTVCFIEQEQAPRYQSEIKFSF